MVEHWVNDIMWVSERAYPGDSTYTAWHCTSCIRHRGSKGWSVHDARKYAKVHYDAKHGGMKK